uniref:Uncharacterized protein n=1 Tax=Leersia perrieri TaxID=77586 RepID=A0A0D9X6Z9_9ORYZ
MQAAPDDDGGVDFAVAAVAVLVVSFAVAASCVVVSFDARARTRRLRRVLDLGPSMRGARLLLASSAGLLAAAETLRLPLLRDDACAYPAYAAALVLALAAVYGPLLASACWTVAAVAINRRMRARASALAALVVAPLPVQVVALALASVSGRVSSSSPAVFGLVGFLAVAVAAGAALAILVLMPVYDALVLGDEEEGQLLPVVANGDGEDARELDNV